MRPSPHSASRTCQNLARVLAVAFLIGIIPVATADADPSAGVVLTTDAPDVAVELRNLGSSAICYIDADGNNAYGAGEPVILRTNTGCTGDTAGSDIRLVAWEGLPAGERLGAARDANKPASSPQSTASFWYFDADGDGRMGVGDSVYANLVNPSRGFVDAGDARVSTHSDHEAGTAVRSGDADVGLQLKLLAAPGSAIGYVETNDNGRFDSLDTLYLNADLGGTELVEFGDLRLMPIDDARPFGSFVSPGDPDGSALYTTASRTPCFTDEDGSGDYTVGDGLYLSLAPSCQGSTSRGDIRLIARDGFDAGSRVQSEDPDRGAAYAEVQNAELSYQDLDGDGRQGANDIFYMDLVSVGSRRIDHGDVRLTPQEGVGGRVLDERDASVGDSLTAIGTFSSSVNFLSISGGTNPSASEAVYLNIDRGGGEGVEPGDIRLTPVRGFPYGGSATLATGEVLPRIEGRGATICISSSDNSAYKAGDAVYLTFTGCSEVVAGSVRLVPLDRFPTGSVVTDADPDLGATLTSPSGDDLSYYDADGDREWTFGDTLYADLVSPNNDRIDVGDVRITATADGAAGTTVRAGGQDVSLPLIRLGSTSSHTAFVDGNNDGRFGASDIAYVDVDGTGIYVTILDVRLVALPSVETAPAETDAETVTDGEPDTETETETVTDQETDTETTTDGEDETEADTETDDQVRTPAPGILLITLTLLTLTAWTRHRRA